VEIAHEALLVAWPRLRDWLHEDRELLRSVGQIAAAAHNWDANGQDPGDLLRGARLADAVMVESKATDRLTEQERRFVNTSREAFEADQVRTRRQHRRLRSLLVGTALMLAVAVVAGTFAWQQRAKADDKAAVASAAARSAETERLNGLPGQLTESNRRLALLTAVEAHRRDPGPAAFGALQQALVGAGNLLGYYGGQRDYAHVTWIDRTHFAAVRADGIDVYELNVPAPTLTLDAADVEHIEAAPDGARLAVASAATVVLVDVATGARTELPLGVTDDVQAMAFSPDGQSIAVGSEKGDLLVFSIADGAPPAMRWQRRAHPEETVEDLGFPSGAATERVLHSPASARRGVTAIEFLPSSSLIATAGFGAVRTWAADTGSAVSSARLTRNDNGSTIVPVAAALAAATVQGEERLVVADRNQIWTSDPERLESFAVVKLPPRGGFAANVNPDSPVDIAAGLLIASYGAGVVRTLSFADGQQAALQIDFADVSDVRLSPDASKGAAVGTDGVIVFSLLGDGLLARTVRGPAPGDAAVSNNGAVVSVASVAGQSSVWRLDNAHGDAQVHVDGYDGEFIGNNRGNELGVALSVERGVALFDLETGEIRTRILGWDVSTGAYPLLSADDRYLLLGADNGYVEVRRTVDGSLVRTIDDYSNGDGTSQNVSILFGPGPEQLTAVDFDDGKVWILELDPDRPVAERGPVGRLSQFEYTPDGSRVVTIGADGAVTVRDVRTFQPTGQTFLGNTSADNGDLGPWFTSDSTRMITVADGKGRLWDMATGVQIGGVFPTGEGWNGNASPNGLWLVTGEGDHMIRWNLDVESWPDLACRAAGRNLTRAEWKQFGPRDTPYRATCPQYPTDDEGAT
jgi:WD40 repeat protein